MDALDQFAVNARARRRAAKLTQEQVARRSGVHPSEVSRLERGVRDPRLSTIVRLAQALDISASELLENVR